MDKREEHYKKVKDILASCKTMDHLKTAVKVANQFTKQYEVGEEDPQYQKLKNLLGLMKIKCRHGREEIIDEDLSASGKEFKVQAGLSGVADLQKLKFEDEEKEVVRLKDVVDRIKSGGEELEELYGAGTHSPEFWQDLCAFHPSLCEKKRKKKLDEEELDEATTTSSVGGYYEAPLMFVRKRKKKKKKKKGDNTYFDGIPVSDAGGIVYPSSKIFTFRNIGESIIITKKDILDESVDSASVGAYVQPKIWAKDSKNWRGKHKKTPGYGKFVKIKDKCNKFPYCSHADEYIEISEKSKDKVDQVFNEGLRDKLPSREKIKDSWAKFVGAAKREGKETTKAAGILKKVLLKQDVSDDEYKFLKEQSLDIAKIFGVLMMGVISTGLPILLEKLLNKKGISILPKDQTSDYGEQEELIESICRKTGKSKKYVHSLINRYL